MSRLGDTLMGMDRTARRPIPQGKLPGGPVDVVRRRPGLVLSAFLLAAILTIMVLVVFVHVRGTIRPAVTSAPAPPSAPAAQATTALPRPAAAAPQPTAGTLLGEGRKAAGRGAFDEAARLFSRATEIDPSDADAWNSLGVARTRLGDLTGGIDAFRKAIALDGMRAEAHRNLAVVLDRQGKDREAARHYRVFLSLVGDDHPERAVIRQRLAIAGADAR
jgi:cytochrome c-type biogenesis protein CcmH/NrfG